MQITKFVGKIAWDIDLDFKRLMIDLNRDGAREELKESKIQELVLKFDKIYGHRLDYRMWRVGVPPYFGRYQNPNYPRRTVETDISMTWARFEDLVEEAINSNELLNIWTLISLIPEFHDECKNKYGDKSFWPDFVWKLDERLFELVCKIDPLEDCRASCGLAAFYFIIQYQHNLISNGKAFDIKFAEELVTQIERWLLEIDVNFKPGFKLQTEGLRTESESDFRLRAIHSASEHTKLVIHLGLIRPFISHITTDISDPELRNRLRLAYLYQRTTWLTARSRRIDEENYRAKNPTSSARTTHRQTDHKLIKEAMFLLDCSAAAFDAGEYLESGRLAYLIFRGMPERIFELEQIKKELSRRNGIYRRIREVGLEVGKNSSDGKQNSAQPIVDDNADFGTHKIQPSKKNDRNLSNLEKYEFGIPFDSNACIFLDQKGNDSWTQILIEFPRADTQSPLEHLIDLTISLTGPNCEAKTETLIAALKIFKSYGLVRSAGEILQQLIKEPHIEKLTVEALMDFVDSVKRCSKLDPFGIDHQRYESWHKIIRDACKALSAQNNGEWLGFHERLRIHETLINRTFVNFAGSGKEKARMLYLKSTEGLDRNSFQELYENTKLFPANWGIINANGAQEFIKEKTEPLVMISVLGFGKYVSFCKITKNGFESKQIEIASDISISQEIEIFKSEAPFWFQYEEESEPSWGPALIRIGKEIVSLVDAENGATKFLLLAVGSKFAQLPLQHLINQITKSKRIIVSIIPNFSSHILEDSYQSVEPGKLVLSSESDQPILEINNVITQSTNEVTLNENGITILTAHGDRASDDLLPRATIGSDSEIVNSQDWIDTLGSRIAIFHCCNSGNSSRSYMAEMGGAPGLALSVGTKSFLGPVSEVASNAACTLQQELFRSPSNTNIAQAYMKAIEKNPECQLYNLYGDPFQKMILS